MQYDVLSETFTMTHVLTRNKHSECGNNSTCTIRTLLRCIYEKLIINTIIAEHFGKS